jgi:hypothetical protein
MTNEIKTRYELYNKQIDMAKTAQNNCRLKKTDSKSKVDMIQEWGNTIAQLERERDALTVERAEALV